MRLGHEDKGVKEEEKMRRKLEIRGREKNPIHLAKVLRCVYIKLHTREDV